MTKGHEDGQGYGPDSREGTSSEQPSLVVEEGARRAAAFETAPDPMLIADLEGRILDLNRAALKRWGVESVRQLRGQSIFVGLPPEEKERVREVGQRVLESGHSWRGELRLRHPSGRTVPVEVAIGLLRDEKGRPQGFIGILRDISDRQRMEQQLRLLEKERGRLAQQLLAALEQERRLLAREIHDGPIQEIAVSIMQLERALLEGRRLKSVQEQIGHAVGMLRQATDELRRIMARLRPALLDELGLADALAAYARTLSMEGDLSIAFETNMSGERLRDDVAIALFRIAQEALSNVARHSQAQRALLRLWRTDRSVVLEVRDWGQGFDPSSVHRSGSEPSGLGLVSMRERAVLIGADFRIESRPGEGTCVRVELPLSMLE